MVCVVSYCLTQGNVCKWQEVDYQTGCCSSTSEPDGGIGGIHCSENCCSEYAYCVSGCLKMEPVRAYNL